ncbi:GRB10-interacting GYF protein 2-like isoform X2 [Clytia hemisphaerica]|uniref:GRB10-interacting GYF protein 2-like isoform X2 n=1 Tax=Clytia hemisphaerica TaxID=252671 RepID=UPI0034D5CA3C
MAAYHNEALRRQRVIDRKVEALARISIRQEEEERRLNEEIRRQQFEKLEQEENRRLERELHLQQCGGKIKPTGYSSKQTQVKFQTQSDLRHQSKILRDHGLVMGHVNGQFFS